MNKVFSCPTCFIPSSSITEDHRDNNFVVALCNNSDCKIIKFYSCIICQNKNIGTYYRWPYNHANQNKYHKLLIEQQLLDNSECSFDDNINGTSFDYSADMSFEFQGSDTNTLFSINNIDNTQEYSEHIHKTSDPVDVSMMCQLAIENNVYKKNLDYFIAVVKNKGGNYIVQQAMSDRPFDYDNRSDGNALHTILQVHLCLNMKDTDKNIHAAIIRHLQQNPGHTMNEKNPFPFNNNNNVSANPNPVCHAVNQQQYCMLT
jgi:hypothetical protein